MLGASFLPARFRSDHGHTENSKPGYLNQRITLVLQSVARKAFTHPIHTIVFVAILASTSYVGILEGSLLGHTRLAGAGSGGIDLTSLVEGGRRLKLGEETGWRWHTENGVPIEPDAVRHVRVSVGIVAHANIHQDSQHLALLTLVFPHSSSNTFPRTAPRREEVSIPSNVSATALPITLNSLSSISQDTSLAFSVPFNEASTLLASIREVPSGSTVQDEDDDTPARPTSSWVMEGAKETGQRPKTIASWAVNAWTSFVDLIKVYRHSNLAKTIAC